MQPVKRISMLSQPEIEKKQNIVDFRYIVEPFKPISSIFDDESSDYDMDLTLRNNKLEALNIENIQKRK